MTSAGEHQFAKAFDWAVVRLATYFPPSASQARLLFASVTLLTNDRPRPASDQEVERYKLRGRNGSIFFRRTVLSAQAAVDWYLSAGDEGILTPMPSELAEMQHGKDGVALTPTSFEDDPSWPSLGVPLSTDLFSNAGGPGDPAPFRGAGAPRIHRRFGDNSGFGDVIADVSAVAFLKRRIHFGVDDYQEYLGGLVLIVPDPVLRTVQHFLIPASDSCASERLVYRLVPRPNQTIDDLQLTILERRSNLLSQFRTVDVPRDGVVTVQSELPFDKTGYAISHPIHGLIAYQQPLPFIRAIRGSIGSAGRRVKVRAPKTESPQSPVETYEFSEFGRENPISVGAERDDAVVRVINAEQRRVRRAAAERYRQTWFDSGQRDEAITFLRRQLAAARSSVIVADPYFGANQIFQFLQAVPRTQIDFTILTSRLAFESEATDIIAKKQATSGRNVSSIKSAAAEKLASFAGSLRSLQSRGMRSVTALVLVGKTPPLHDRFLVIDEEVFFLGNSLNALGERASLIIRLPDGEPVIGKLQEISLAAVPFPIFSERYLSVSPTNPEDI